MQHLRPIQSSAGEILPLQASTAEAALYQLKATKRMLKTSEAAPISLTQAGAFHAAKSIQTNKTVRTDMPMGPPSTNNVGREVRGIREERSIIILEGLNSLLFVDSRIQRYGDYLINWSVKSPAKVVKSPGFDPLRVISREDFLYLK